MQARIDELRSKIPGYGSDRDFSRRPGAAEGGAVPLDGAARPEPERQVPRVPVLTLKGRAQPALVVSNAEPPHGLSGRIRAWAYNVGEQRARHWLLLFLADRVEVVERRLMQSPIRVLARA